MHSPTGVADKPRVVLDTNAALDWMVFLNANMQPWANAIAKGRVQWILSQRMRDELEHMAAHQSLSCWQPDTAAIGHRIATLGVVVVANASALVDRLRCTDADDQVFIDVALQHRARWLLTHDKALLKLARRSAVHGLRICRPADATP